MKHNMQYNMNLENLVSIKTAILIQKENRFGGSRRKHTRLNIYSGRYSG